MIVPTSGPTSLLFVGPVIFVAGILTVVSKQISGWGIRPKVIASGRHAQAIGMVTVILGVVAFINGLIYQLGQIAGDTSTWLFVASFVVWLVGIVVIDLYYRRKRRS